MGEGGNVGGGVRLSSGDHGRWMEEMPTHRFRDAGRRIARCPAEQGLSLGDGDEQVLGGGQCCFGHGDQSVSLPAAARFWLNQLRRVHVWVSPRFTARPSAARLSIAASTPVSPTCQG